jgi:hypothetical protein
LLPASPADIDVRAAFPRSVGTDLDSASSTIRRRRRSRSRSGRRRRRCLIAIIRSCNLISSPSAPATTSLRNDEPLRLLRLTWYVAKYLSAPGIYRYPGARHDGRRAPVHVNRPCVWRLSLVAWPPSLVFPPRMHGGTTKCTFTLSLRNRITDYAFLPGQTERGIKS